MLTSPCPSCGRPTAANDSPEQRHDHDYCSPVTSPECWGPALGPVHHLASVITDESTCGSADGGASTHRGSVTCEACLAVM